MEKSEMGAAAGTATGHGLTATIGEVAGVSAPELAEEVFGERKPSRYETLLEKHALLQVAAAIAGTVAAFRIVRFGARLLAGAVRKILRTA